MLAAPTELLSERSAGRCPPLPTAGQSVRLLLAAPCKRRPSVLLWQPSTHGCCAACQPGHAQHHWPALVVPEAPAAAAKGPEARVCGVGTVRRAGRYGSDARLRHQPVPAPSSSWVSENETAMQSSMLMQTKWCSRTRCQDGEPDKRHAEAAQILTARLACPAARRRRRRGAPP